MPGITVGSWRIAIERVLPTQHELVQMYDAGAQRWHQSIQTFGYPQAYTNLLRRLRTGGILPPLSTSTPVLDCGIGTGALTLSLAQAFAGKLRLDGVDISPQMLQQARQRLQMADVTVQLHQQSADALPFADQSFNLVMSAHMFEHLPDPHCTLVEMARVLKPGAQLLLIISRPHWYTTLLQLRWRYQAYRPTQVWQLINEVGLQAVGEYAFTNGLASWTSRAYVASKIGKLEQKVERF